MRLISAPVFVFHEYHSGSGGHLDGIVVARARVGDRVGGSALDEEEGRFRREGLDDRDVDPDLLSRRRQQELEAGAEAGARPRDAPPVLVHVAGLVDAHSEAKELDFELDGLEHGSPPALSMSAPDRERP